MRVAPQSRERVAPTHAQMSPEQKKRAEALTCLFENSTVVQQYGYVEALGDGRGITAGRAGFTTATGDLVDVVRRYTAAEPGNSLAKFLPRLTQLAASESDSTKGLLGLTTAWKNAAADPKFRQAQDDVVEGTYFRPAMKCADQNGIKSALGQACLYDTIIQHGDGTDPDGLPALLAQAKAKAGGTPASGVDEKKWLQAFLEVRRADLAHAHDPATRKVWAESVGRVDVLLQQLHAGNLQLRGPIHVTTGDWKGAVVP